MITTILTFTRQSSGLGDLIGYLIVFIVVSLIIFLIMREVVTWYWKINRMIGLQEKQIKNQEEQLKLMILQANLLKEQNAMLRQGSKNE
ncbi:hypothetical protein [Haloplasma contractile]|uniref:Uncharacterized protein n=1 Tax=Haloplasma contractile SSD-17B TaxID=1033810 RepID=U2E868_9MOLU|nr:hypothetical protein [Haloplasma contractile]ERJ11076.1 hypothetical protein HLPCO_002897 [Haloplasma contractile SSD-17B]